MPFTAEQDAFILMAHFRSGTQNPDGSWTYSLSSCMAQFSEEFPSMNYDYDYFVKHRSDLIKRFKSKHCICKGKSSGRSKVLTKTVIENIRRRKAQNPKMSFSQLSAETGVSIGSCHKALKNQLHT